MSPDPLPCSNFRLYPRVGRLVVVATVNVVGLGVGVGEGEGVGVAVVLRWMLVWVRQLFWVKK